MDLQTTYLGLKLRNPLLAGASPLCDDLDVVRRLEDAGVGGLIMHSLFEEQITQQQVAEFAHTENPADMFAEATSFFPRLEEYHLGPDRYFAQIEKIKSAVSLPLIASLNGTTPGGWVENARHIEAAGADALELNVYYLPTSIHESGAHVEQRTLDILKMVVDCVKIPVAVKLSPFFSAPANFAHRLDKNGASGLVLFNRFYQPDIDIEELNAQPRLELSTPAELRLRLRWAAILCGHVSADISISGGVHSVNDVIKSIMTGAATVQMVSALLRRGPEIVRDILFDLSAWLEEKEYTSLAQMRGSMSLQKCPDPSAFERANYLRTLQLWKVDSRHTSAWLEAPASAE